MTTARKLAAARQMLAELAALLAEIEVGAEQSANPESWVETSVAAERLGIPLDSIRYLCREKGYGRKVGGRWEADLSGLRRYLGKHENREETARVSRATKGHEPDVVQDQSDRS